MVKYAQNELFSVTDFEKQMGSIIKEIKEHTIEKIGVLKNYEDMIEMMEHKEIYNIIQKRKNTPKSSYVPMEDMAKNFNIDLNSI